MDRSQIEALENAAKGASKGLPLEVFHLVSSLTPLINVDLLVQDAQGRTLLTWRQDDFYGPGWHIPGGIIRFKERWEDRIAAVAAIELGATVTFSPQPISIRQILNPVRDVRGHFISMLFACQLSSVPDPAHQWIDSALRNGDWAWHTGCPADIISVHEMYRSAIDTRPAADAV
jgi:ADP-ribose pyrophosphatase YjhB (NUDIX family)